MLQRSIALTCVLLLCSAVGWAQAGGDPLSDSTQCIVVLAKSWHEPVAEALRFERSSATADWQPVGERMRAVVGRKGMAWGRGIGKVAPAPGEPTKAEGDGCAPAGVFDLGTAFGFGSALREPHHSYPYLRITPSMEAVDDVNSRFYNQIVDRSQIGQVDWRSSEKMSTIPRYVWGLFINHNLSPVVPGAGSCIFLHVWRAPDNGTVGCTALAESDVARLLSWLDPARKPRLVQMPRAAYEMVREMWKLPRWD